MLLSTFLLLCMAPLLPLALYLHRLVVWILDNRRRLPHLGGFPRDPRHWFWGNLHKYNGTAADLDYKVDLMRKMPYGRVFFVGPFHYYLSLYHPESVSVLLKTADPKPLKISFYAAGLAWLGEGLLLAGGKKWARNRKLLTKAFHFGILRPYMDIYNKASEIMLEKLARAARSGESMEMVSPVSLLSLDIILRCIFSYDNHCQETGETHPYVKAVGKLTDLWLRRFGVPWQQIDWLYYLSKDGRQYRKYCNYVHSVSEGIIKKRRASLETNDHVEDRSRYQDFLDILLTVRDEQGQGLSDTDIRAEVDTFLFEGHDTTATSISWMLYSMAAHPQHQVKVQREIDSALAGRDSDEILWEDLDKLPYLTMCLKESMRCHSPVPFLFRETTEPRVICGTTVPAGTLVGIDVFSTHHNPTIWDNPMEYRPERFTQEEMDKRHNFAFIPFSAGPRNCIGKHLALHEQKTVLARILHRFTFELDPNHPVEKKPSLLMKAKDGIKLHVKLRK